MSKDKDSKKLCKCGQTECICAKNKISKKHGTESFSISKGDKQEIQVVEVPTGTTAQKPPADSPKEIVYAMKVEQVAECLKDKGYTVTIVSTAKEAADFVMEKIVPARKGDVVSFGGSMTVTQSGLYQSLKSTEGLKIIDTYDFSVGAEAMVELRRQSLLSDLYISSANALTKDGKLLFLDGICNRTAAVQFGPRQVVLLIGRNKICTDVEAGIERIKNIAAPANAIRLKRKTPCTKTGVCMDCKSPESICTAWLLLRRCSPIGRIQIVLINEDLGF